MQTETKIYWKHGDVVAESGNIKVYEMDESLYLEQRPGHNLWALEQECIVYLEQFIKQEPVGEVLEVGLGLGVASRLLMSFPKVEHLTTVEKNKNVINTHDATIHILDNRLDKWPQYNYSKHTKINDDGLRYLLNTDQKFDYIFLDFFKAIDEDTLPVIKDMVNASKRCLTKKGIVVGWLDPYTQSDDYKEFEEIFKG